MPYKVFVAGEEALAADVNSYLMSQTVPRFTNAAQRTAQLTAPVTNQLSMLDDRVGVLQRYSGTAWVDMPGAQVRFAAGNPGIVANTGQDITLTTLTMPFAGSVIMNAQINAAPGGGATALEIVGTADPSPASVPAPGASLPGAGGAMPANLYSVSFPISGSWNLAAGASLTAKARCSSSAGATMGWVISAFSATFLLVPTLF